MKKLETKTVHDGFEVVEDGVAVGRVTKSSSGYGWHSYQAKAPFHQGRCETEAGALAHLGFRRVRLK